VSIPSIKGSKKFPNMAFLFLIQKIVSSTRLFPLFCDIENLAIRKNQSNLLNLHWKKKNPNFPWVIFFYFSFSKSQQDLKLGFTFLENHLEQSFLLCLSVELEPELRFSKKCLKRK